MIAVLLVTYGAVFVAEIAGDKLLYTTGVLATRYRTVPIMVGMLLAFMAKMAVAVAVGSAISKLPRALVAVLTGLSFAGVAITIWRKPSGPAAAEKDSRSARAAALSFAAIFFGMGRRRSDHRGCHGSSLRITPAGLDRRCRRHGHQGCIGRFARSRGPALDWRAHLAPKDSRGGLFRSAGSGSIVGARGPGVSSQL